MQIINLLLDLFFPRRCVRCEKEGSWLCTNCELLAAAELLSISKHDNHISLFKFEPGPIRELLHRLKYNGIRECAETLGVFLEKYGNRAALQEFVAGGVLVPIPVSRTRLRQRGYNQAEELALALGRWLEIPVSGKALQRVGKRKSLVGQTAIARRESMRGEFRATQLPEEYAQKHIILVDDVCTTGSTLAACRESIKPFTSLPVRSLELLKAKEKGDHRRGGRPEWGISGRGYSSEGRPNICQLQ